MEADLVALISELKKKEAIEFIDPGAEAAYRRRARRIADVIQLKVPDRVPEQKQSWAMPYAFGAGFRHQLFFPVRPVK